MPAALRLPLSAFILPLLVLAAACAPTPPDPARLDPIAVRYVELTLGMRHHDPDFVDAYYGPDSLKARADADSLTVAEIGAAADSLLAVLGDAVPTYADSLVAMRHRYLVGQLTAVRTRARMLGGEKLDFLFIDGDHQPTRKTAAVVAGAITRFVLDNTGWTAGR